MSYVKKTSAEQPLVQSSKSPPHTIDHTAHSATSLEHFQEVHEPGLFQSNYFQSNNLKRWYSLIEPQVFPCKPQIPYICSLLSPHIYRTSNRRHIWNPVKHLWWCFFAETVNMLKSLAIFAGKLHRGCLAVF